MVRTVYIMYVKTYDRSTVLTVNISSVLKSQEYTTNNVKVRTRC